MPYSSAEISGMIGGQMAMFSNQAAFSQQIGGQIGTSPMMGPGGGMQNPFPQPHMGSRIAGGVTGMAGAAATGLAIGGGLMGGAAGWLDPYTAAARGFSAGTGGAGFIGGLSNIGGAFAQGGLRAGIGMMGTGMAGAAIAAAPAMALGAGLQYTGSQMYQGVQHVEDVRAMSGHFGTQFGAAGASWGGGMGHQTIKKITGALHELVGEDMRTTMEEIKQVMDNAGRMGMLTGITDAATFKQKFGGIVKQVRQVADIMGTTLAEAAPMLGQMNQMGLWSSADVMGTAVAGKIAGPNAGAMMGAMGQGAQVSHAMGGTMRAGAMMSREAFMDVQAAQQAGVLSNRDIMEYTGGTGGARGMQMMAGSMQRMMSQFSQTSAGRLMMAGLGQRDESGAFTGQIDKGRLQEFLSGGLTVQDLSRLGRKQLSGPNAATFMDVQEELGQNLGAQGGIGAMAQITEQVLGKFGGNDKVKQQLMRQMFGMSNRDAKLFKKMFDDAGKIRDQEERAAEDAINQAFENLERKQYRSWEGLTTAVGGMWREGISRPLQEAGEKLATDFGEKWETLSGKLTGRTRRIAMGQGERGRLIRQGALTTNYENLGVGTLGASFAQGGVLENVIRGINETSMGDVYGRVTAGMFTMGLSEAGFAAAGIAEGPQLTRKQQALQRIGVGPGADIETMRTGIREAFTRAQTPTREALGFKGEVDKGRVDEFKSGLRKIMGQKSEEFRRLKEEDPKGYAKAVLSEMGKPATRDNLNMLAIAQEEEGYAEDLRADFKQMSADVGHIPTSPEELAEFQNDQLREITATFGGVGGYGFQDLTAKQAMMEEFSKGNILKGLQKGIQAVGNIGIDRADVEKALTGRGSGVMQKYLSGQISKEDAIEQLNTMGEEGATARRLIATGQADDKKDAFQKFFAARGMQAQMTALPRIREVAVKGPAEINLGRGGGALQEEFKSIVETYRGGEDLKLSPEEVQQAQERVVSLGGKLTAEQAETMRRRGGAVGRQIAAISDVSRFEGGGEKDTSKLLNKLMQSGYDVESMGDERMKEILKDKKISKEEAKEFGEKAADIIKTSLSETAESRKTHNEKLMELLNTYADKHEKFVRAVDNAIDLKDPGDAPEAEKPATPEEEK